MGGPNIAASGSDSEIDRSPMPMRRILLTLACLTAGGCAGLNPAGPAGPGSGIGASLEDAAPPRAASPAPEGKRLTELVNTAFTMAKLTGAPEASPVRATHDSQWGDWMFCVKSSAADQQLKYAVLIGHDAILEVRSSVLIDGCDKETYQPLAPVKPVKAGHK
jgi:hypothetical protein